MRLIHTTTFQVHEFTGDSDQDYAILSHTWGEDECCFQDMVTPEVYLRRQGFQKVKYCCDQAAKDGLQWAWADSCCIDKTSTAELSEAINSMFRWYNKAVVCYVYLADVTAATPHELAASRWFTRGWTLQELIAPHNVQFYSCNWCLVGTKTTLQETIHSITGIDKAVLCTGNFAQVCVARRMAWAARRNTTRIEDQAYSLMGIFDVNMPLIYGEGKKAFVRLQQEILKVSDDQSLFAWGAPTVFQDIHQMATAGPDDPQMHSLLADSPEDFFTEHEILQVRHKEDRPPPVIHGNAVRIQYPVFTKTLYDFIMIACTTRDRNTAYLAIPVKRWSDSFCARCSSLVLVFAQDWPRFRVEGLVIKQPDIAVETDPWPNGFRIIQFPSGSSMSGMDLFNLVDVYCPPHAAYSPMDHSITFPEEVRNRSHAVLFFQASKYLLQKKAHGGQFPIQSFAVIIGMRRLPWAIFIPVLRNESADADFHDLLRTSPKLIQFCTTKSWLINTVFKDDLSKLTPNSVRLGTRLVQQPLATWNGASPRAFGINRRVSQRWQLQLKVKFRVAPTNLINRGIFVSLYIREVKVGFGAKLSSLHDFEYISDSESTDSSEPTWFEASQSHLLTEGDT